MVDCPAMPIPASETCAAVPMRTLHDLAYADLQRTLADAGVSPVHARVLWRALYRSEAPLTSALPKLPPPLRRWLENGGADHDGLAVDRPELSTEIASSDGLTRKFLLRLEDGQTVETVLMGYSGRHTACVSSQAGCAMGCVFCATGQMGFVRHLRPGEIVAQVLHARRALGTAGQLRNLVLMGMGEPLHNYDAVLQALDIISDTGGLNLGPSRISISTVGVVPGILRLAREARPYHLAVSLHGADDAERSALVPAGRRWPMAELMAACREYIALTGRKIFFEWTLIAGQNDSPRQAAKLGELLRGMRAHVNLIPLNPTNGFNGLASEAHAATEFQRVLRTTGLPSTVRQRRGIDVAAGCGQLRAERRGREIAPVE
jgi:23S rRNA (adenine2503-C2)-methyltransferase